MLRIKANISQLDSLIGTDQIQQQNLQTLTTLITSKFSHAEKLILLKKEGHEKAVRLAYDSNVGKKLMDSIRITEEAMVEREEQILSKIIEETFKDVSGSKVIFVTESIFSILTIIFLTILITRELTRRAKNEKTLAKNLNELETKNKEIEQFVFIASHDLQEPLKTISNYVSLFHKTHKEKLDHDSDKYLNFIKGATSRMETLINDLMNYLRIGRDKNKLTIDCNKILQDVLSDMAPSIKKSGGEIHWEQLPVVNGYIDLKLVFENLISNAIKFRKKDVKLAINITSKETAKEWLFAIKDNGIGINKKYHDRLFIIFRKLQNQSEYPGTGIGLALCKKIVEIHGGKIWLESDLGKGSTFYFTLTK